MRAKSASDPGDVTDARNNRELADAKRDFRIPFLFHAAAAGDPARGQSY